MAKVKAQVVEVLAWLGILYDPCAQMLCDDAQGVADSCSPEAKFPSTGAPKRSRGHRLEFLARSDLDYCNSESWEFRGAYKFEC